MVRAIASFIIGGLTISCGKSDAEQEAEARAEEQTRVVNAHKAARERVAELEKRVAASEPVARAPERPTWRSFVRTDKMDDSKQIGIELVGDERVVSYLGQPFQPRFYVWCHKNITNAQISLGALLSSEVRAWESSSAYGYRSGIPVRLRLDEDKPTSHFGGESSDNTSVYLQNPVSVLKKMIGKSRLTVEYTPVGHGSRTVAFSISGIGDAMAELRKSCRW